jgi:hypothetical protein
MRPCKALFLCLSSLNHNFLHTECLVLASQGEVPGCCLPVSRPRHPAPFGSRGSRSRAEVLPLAPERTHISA